MSKQAPATRVKPRHVHEWIDDVEVTITKRVDGSRYVQNTYIRRCATCAEVRRGKITPAQLLTTEREMVAM